MTTKQATAKIAELLKQSENALAEASQIAENNGLEFEYRNPDDSGGKYISFDVAKAGWSPSGGCEWEESFQGDEGSDYGWVSSSSQCS